MADFGNYIEKFYSKFLTDGKVIEIRDLTSSKRTLYEGVTESHVQTRPTWSKHIQTRPSTSKHVQERLVLYEVVMLQLFNFMLDT